MVLPMSRPQKHRKTGIYWLRKRVPGDLVAVLGKSEVTATLETKDPAEAKIRHATMLAELEEKWARLRQSRKEITEREAHAYAKVVGDLWLGMFRDDPSLQVLWHPPLFDRIWADAEFPSKEAKPGSPGEISMEEIFVKSMRRRCLDEADKILADNGFNGDAISVHKTARAVGEALQRASEVLAVEARGVYAPGTEPSIPARTPATAVEKHDGGRTSLTGLVKDWWKEASATGRKPSTQESYTNTFALLVRFLGHDDATRVTTEDIIRFKDHRLQTPSSRTGKPASARTVKGSDLTAFNSVFGWAVSNRRLTTNPAAGVKLRVPKPQRLRSKGFSDDEAKAILAACLAHSSDREHPKMVAAKRWIPWICAFSGARVGEIGQLRKQDIYPAGDLWVMKITPEAGTVKANIAREVVLHQQLLDLGLLKFHESAAYGHLFIDPREDGDVLKPLGTLKNRLEEFARKIVTDRNVAPTHGWRHRFKTVGMEVGIAPRILDAIQGHSARTAGESYGDVTLKTIARAIRSFPHLPLDTTSC